MFDDEMQNTGAADETPAAMPADDAAATPAEPTTEGAGSEDSAAV